MIEFNKQIGPETAGRATSGSAAAEGPNSQAGNVPPPPQPHPAVTRATGSTSGFGALEVVTAGGGVIRLEGEYEQVVGSIEKMARRIKELEKVAVPKFPTITNIRQWHNQLGIWIL